VSTVGVDASNGGRTEETWTVLRLILWSADYLKEKGIESGRLDAEHLLASVVGVGRLQLYLEFERPLTREELDGFRPLVKRRAAREPLQYIIGRQPFRELDLEVGPGVLIPRPETELLVGKVLEWLEERALQDAVILDVGTGTGAISLSIATEGRGIRVTATDVSDAALEIAGRNRDAAELSSSVELRKGSVFEPLTDGERFDVITSNPPYVPEVDEEALEPEVRDWEPREALFAGADGMNVLRRIVSEAGGYLKPDGLLALEVGFGQAQDVAGLLEATGEFKDVRVLRDYAGKERFVFAHGA
jgi:release factor glutamine methyltransferase